MPANVTPEFEKAERRYREATTDAERLDALQDMLATIPKVAATSDPMPTILGVTSNMGNNPFVRVEMSPKVKSAQAPPTPSTAPAAARKKLSARMKANNSRRRKPMAFRIASSRKRSRMAMLIVLAVTSNNVKTTALEISVTSILILPHIEMKPS